MDGAESGLHERLTRTGMTGRTGRTGSTGSTGLSGRTLEPSRPPRTGRTSGPRGPVLAAVSGAEARVFFAGAAAAPPVLPTTRIISTDHGDNEHRRHA